MIAIEHYSNAEHGMMMAAHANLRNVLSGFNLKEGCVRGEYVADYRYWHQLEIFWSWFKKLQHGECREEEHPLREVMERVTKNHYPQMDAGTITDEARSALSPFLFREANKLTASREVFRRFSQYLYSLYVALG